MGIIVATLLVVVIFEAIIIFKLRAKNKQLLVQSAVNLFKEHINSEDERGSNYGEPQMPELSEEENQREAEQAQKVHILCRLAESHLEDLSDEYESNKLNERIGKAFQMAKEIKDPFYFSFALHPIIVLAHQAGLYEMKNKLLELVSDPLIKEKVFKDINK